MIHRIHFLCLAVLFASTSLSWSQEQTENTTRPTIAAIDDVMQQFVDEGQIAGAVTLLGHKGKVVHLGAVGLADIESQKEMRPFKMFSIASMTKPITATAVMILQDEGKLHVDDKIGRYLPAFKNVKLQDGSPAAREITIRDAITHTSGIVGSQTFDTSLQATVDEMAARPLAFQPGSNWRYGPGLTVAGRIVEIVAEQPFEEFVQERIFKPLEMKNTTFFPDEKQQRQIATIYAMSDDKQSLLAVKNRIINPSTVTAPNPSGGLFSTARDMFLFYQMVLSGGQFRKGPRVVSRQAVQKMTSPQTGDLETGFTPGNCWGLGWCIVRQPQGVTETLSAGTFGHGGAFGTQGWVDPKTKTIYVLLIQRNDLGNGDASEIRKAFHKTAAEALEL